MVLEQLVEQLSAAKRKVGRLGQYAVLGLALAFGACGEGNVAGDDDDQEAPCGDSPLTGKYLWNVGNCESGSQQPFDGETCTGFISYKELPSAPRTIVYQGLELRFPTIDNWTILLTKQPPTCEPLEDSQDHLPYPEGYNPPRNDRCGFVSCIMGSNPSIYGAIEEGRYLTNDAGIWLESRNQWPGSDECGSITRGWVSWQECKRYFLER